MDDENNNMSNTQDADEQMPVTNVSDMNESGSEDRQDAPAPNNGEGEDEDSHGDNLPEGGEEDDSEDMDDDDQETDSI